MFVDIIYAILLIGTWLLILKNRRLVKTWTGNFYWAEKYIGRGGTYLVIIFAGIFCIGLWVIYPFGWLDLLFGTNNSIK